jgi:cytochrome c556
MRVLASIGMAAAAAILCTPASAQFAKPEDAIKYRQSALYVMAQQFGRLGAMAQGKAPYDANAAAENAELVQTMSHLPWPAFGPGTDKGRDTRAKPEIWADQAKFKEAQERLMNETSKLMVAAKAGNLDALKPAVQATGAACKNCHDQFRRD